MNRRHFMKAALVAGGIALAGVAVVTMNSGAPVGPGVTREYDGADDPAALTTLIAHESQGRFAMVMFHAPWCPYCRRLTDQLNAAAPSAPVPYGVLKVNAEKYPALSSAFMTQDGVPETHVFLNGQVVDSFVGTASDKHHMTNYLHGLSREFENMLTKPQVSLPSPYTPSH